MLSMPGCHLIGIFGWSPASSWTSWTLSPFLLNSLPFCSPLLSGTLGSSWTKNCLLLLRYSQLIPRSPPALPPYPRQTAWPLQASSSIYPTLKRRQANVFPVSCIEPCFLLSSPRFVFPIGFSLYLTLFPQQLSQSSSHFI